MCRLTVRLAVATFVAVLGVAALRSRYRLMVSLDMRLHHLNCRCYKAGRMRLFRFLKKVERPLCDRVALRGLTAAT